MKQCPRCSYIATDDNKFCPNCGYPGYFTNNQGKQNPPVEFEEKNMTIICEKIRKRSMIF